MAREPRVPRPANMVSLQWHHMVMVIAVLAVLMLMVLIAIRGEYECACVPCNNTFIRETISCEGDRLIEGAHSFLDSQYLETGEFKGYSMQPTIFEGNTLMLQKITEYYVLKPGEIVRYTTVSYPECKALQQLNPEIPYTIHRVKAIYSENEIHVQGDNNDRPEIIRRCQITHIVTGVLFT